jgi:hypothetical protein
MCEIDRGLAKESVRLVGTAIGNEVAVELELSEGKVLQVREPGAVTAEIVDGELHVERRQHFAQLGGEFQIANDVFFGDIDDQAGPVTIAGRLARTRSEASANITSGIRSSRMSTIAIRRDKAGPYSLFSPK